MDSKDRQIISALQQNARLSNQDLADRINLSPTPTLRRVRQLEEQGILKGYTAIVDQKSWGLPITVFVRIKLERHSDETVNAFETAINEMSEVMDCWLMTGRWDYLLRALAADLPAYEGFVRSKLQRLPGIAAIDTSFAYSRVKQGQILPEIDPPLDASS
ncbi:MAG: Lrp/AsnC family transcriptional regulator [Pseudomonadota bacterium]